MSFTDDVPKGAKNFTKLPQVDGVCALLNDPIRTGIKVRPRVVLCATRANDECTGSLDSPKTGATREIVQACKVPSSVTASGWHSIIQRHSFSVFHHRYRSVRGC